MYRHELTVLPSEAGCTGEMKLRALLNRMQDIAGLAVEKLEGAPGELLRRGYGWVLLKYELEIAGRLPLLGETVAVETRHTTGDGFHTLRVFRVFAAANETETLVLAKTSWVLFDLAVGRPVRAARHIPEIFSGTADDPPIDPDFAAIPKFSAPLLREVPVLGERAFPVRFHDLDSNGHVNNAVYFEWAFEGSPLNPLAWSLREMRAEFRVSAKLGDTVRVRVKELRQEPETQEQKARAFVHDMTAEDGRTEEGGEEGECPGKGECPGEGERPLARFFSVWTPQREE
jgi:acyl-ACP thioesterase